MGVHCSGGRQSHPQEGEAGIEKKIEMEAQGFSESGSDVGGRAPRSQAQGAAARRHVDRGGDGEQQWMAHKEGTVPS